jgi:hypothetical protein
MSGTTHPKMQRDFPEDVISETPLPELQKSQSTLYFNKFMGINWGWGRFCLAYVFGKI